MTQRDMMRQLHLRLRGDQSRVVEAYAKAERRGDVRRARNDRTISSEEYASRLYADGIRKGWIDERQPSLAK